MNQNHTNTDSESSENGEPGDNRPAQNSSDTLTIHQLIGEGLAGIGKLTDDSKQLIKAEWSLTQTSLVLTLLCVLCFSGMVLMCWLFVCLTVGFYAFKLGIAPIYIMLSMSAIQILLCVTLWKAGKYFAKHVGFSQSIKLMSVLFSK